MTIRSSYSQTAPLLFGVPDGVIRPARMVAMAFGVRKNTEVWVTGSGVDDAVGRFIELVEGDVLIEDDLPSERIAGVDESGLAVSAARVETGRRGEKLMVSLGNLTNPLEPATPELDKGGSLPSGVSVVSLSEFDGAGLGRVRFEREVLGEMDGTEVLAIAAGRGLDVQQGRPGRPSKARAIETIMADQDTWGDNDGGV